jgi:hypothetical protein
MVLVVAVVLVLMGQMEQVAVVAMVVMEAHLLLLVQVSLMLVVAAVEHLL